MSDIAAVICGVLTSAILIILFQILLHRNER